MSNTNNIDPTRTVTQHVYKETLNASREVNRKIEDIIGGEKQLDFGKPFLPESLARIEDLDFLEPDEKRIFLNQIKGPFCLFLV